MQHHRILTLAAEPITEVLGSLRADQFDLPTPCAEFTVRQLVEHLIEWVPALEGAARKEFLPPSPGPADAEALLAQIDRLVRAWGRAEAWQGMTRVGGPTEFPAEFAGGMVLGELVVHGWDLARAVSWSPQWNDEVLLPLHGILVETAQLGRDMGVYAARVEVPDESSTVDKVLGLTGRDPGWRA
ncbi:TIGR03086 family metal-binding protein [Kutzneria albida]|uniref:Mycothiol-dependent maleylpyruvate isomerase metal-binding domain-containing protein n=1 Tax=Kutzneria albida DSM 43870 TaxID=1449976 RepID=W5W134_9PSEU|nr:TIGR03086 family metal-binding protein [Kutzneria albida]AHH94505.1 hypothetical protein KALB_1132 [Kutzneria albida DSM 43870]